ncbi:MAG: ABC transporter substrate-binding protein [Deferrisomatales bacterium]
MRRLTLTGVTLAVLSLGGFAVHQGRRSEPPAESVLQLLTPAAEAAPVVEKGRGGPRPGAEIVVGNLADLTGPTGSVGRPYADGIRAYTEWLNARGGINGKQVKLLQTDYAYKIPEALSAYKAFKDSDRVIAIQGWGTGDTEALTQQVAKDEMPYFSASYSARLADPAKAPYNFFTSADYSTQFRAGLQYIKENWKESRKPRLALVYPDHPYGKAPIAAGKKFAEELGFELVGEEIVSLNAIEATSQVLSLKKHEPDFTWLGGTTPSCAVVIKDGRKLGLKTRFFVNIWGNDENLLKLAGDAAEGVLGLQGAVAYGADVPGMKPILEVTRNEPQMTHYVRGWVSMMAMCEALKLADSAGDLTGKGIKNAAERLREFGTQGLTAPITFTATDHRPNMSAVVVEYQGGKIVTRKTVLLDRKVEWLGF